MEGLGLLAAVASALPRIHGAGPAGRGRRPARLAQTPVAVGQQGPGDLREMQVQEGQDEQFVPEDMATVGLAVQSAGRHTHIEIGGVRREGLQHMEEMQPQHLSGLARHLQLRPLPQALPRGFVGREQRAEVTGPPHPADGSVQRIADRRIARRVQSDGLLDDDRGVGRDRQPQRMGGGAVPGDEPYRGGDAAGHLGSGGHRDENVGGGGAALQPHGVRLGGSGVPAAEVPAVQIAVAVDARVGDIAVEGGFHLQLACPALGGELGSQGGQMWIPHVYESGLHHGDPAALRVTEPHPSRQRALAQIQDLSVLQQRTVVGGEPGAGRGAAVEIRVGGSVAGPKAQRQPVRQVDDVLVLDRTSGYGRGQPVVAARRVGPRIVRGAGRLLGGGAAVAK